MARNDGRDITLSLVTDLSRFDPDRAADDLEDLDRAADRASDSLEDAGDRAERAGRGFRAAGDGARRAADETDDSMDEIRETSRGAANEIASGFDGSFDSVVGGLQGMVSEFGLALSPAAMAGFMAGAAAIGAVWARVSASMEKTQERVDGLTERMRALHDSGGALSTEDLRGFIDGLEDSSAEILRMKDDADALGVAMDTVARARYGDAEAIAEVTRAINDQQHPLGGWADAITDLQGKGEALLGVESDSLLSMQRLGIGTRSLSEETAKATEAMAARNEMLGGLTDAEIELNEALKGNAEALVEISSTVESASTATADSVIASAQAQADATADMTDTWADYAAGSRAAADEIIAEQERQIAELAEFQANVQAALEQGGADLVAWASEQDDAPAAMAMAAKMTPEQAREIGSNYRQTLELAGEDMIKGTDKALEGTKKSGRNAGESSGDAYVDGFVSTVKSPSNQKRMNDAVRVSQQPSPWLGAGRPGDRSRRNP